MNINDAFNLLGLTQESTQAEIKKAYKRACLKYHPDKNPAGTQIMQAINEAYEFLKKLGDTVEHQNTVKPDQGFNINDYAEELSEILNELIKLDGLIIEICGNWIWISGDTKAHAKKLGKNGLGCFWASKKKMWYYRPADYKSAGRGTFSMDEIRAKYGADRASQATKKMIAA